MDTYTVAYYVWLSAELQHIKTYITHKNIHNILLPIAKGEVLFAEVKHNSWRCSSFNKAWSVGSLAGILQPCLITKTTIPLCPWWAHVETVTVQLTLSSSLISSSPSSRPHRLTQTSSIGGRKAPAAPTLQSASAEPQIPQPWPGSRVWMEARATSQSSTERWSRSSRATRRLWSEPLSAPSYTAEHARRRLCRSLGAGRSRSREDGLPSQPSDLGTRTPDRRTWKAAGPQGNGGHGSGSHGGKAPRWGGVRSEGCSLDMLL